MLYSSYRQARRGNELDAQTRELIREAQNGNKEAMEELTVTNIKMIQGITNKYKKTGFEPDDLFQIASIGFVRAIKLFDLSTDYELSTYAYRLIHQELYNYLRKQGTIKTPRAYLEIQRLMKKHNCFDKTPEEIAKIIGVKKVQTIKEAIEHLHKGKVLSLNKVIGDNDKDDITLEDTVSGSDSSFWDDNLAISEAIKTLNEREKLIVDLRYKKDMSQREVAKMLGVSQVQVSRLERTIIGKIRIEMGLATELPVVDKRTGKGKQPPKGDREKAMHLLKTSSLSYPDINKLTGVPIATLALLGKDHRPQAIKDMIKKRGNTTKGELNVYEA